VADARDLRAALILKFGHHEGRYSRDSTRVLHELGRKGILGILEEALSWNCGVLGAGAYDQVEHISPNSCRSLSLREREGQLLQSRSAAQAVSTCLVDCTSIGVHLEGGLS
jgi:hypothetical protein